MGDREYGPINGFLLETVAHWLMELLYAPQFTDSRWVTLGRSCRSLVGALSGGLQGLMHFTRAYQKVSDYYLHGFSQLDATATRYAIVHVASTANRDILYLHLSRQLRDKPLGS